MFSAQQLVAQIYLVRKRTDKHIKWFMIWICVACLHRFDNGNSITGSVGGPIMMSQLRHLRVPICKWSCYCCRDGQFDPQYPGAGRHPQFQPSTASLPQRVPMSKWKNICSMYQNGLSGWTFQGRCYATTCSWAMWIMHVGADLIRKWITWWGIVPDQHSLLQRSRLSAFTESVQLSV